MSVQLENEDLPLMPNLPQYEVIGIESQTEIDRKKAGMLLTLSPTKVPPQDIQTPQDVDDESGRKTADLHKIHIQNKLEYAM